VSASEFWEDRYSTAPAVWSGRVNESLARVAVALAPGRALDLGCGEGADALWLARRGWQVTAVDISVTALERGRAAALKAGLPPERIEWVAADLATWQPEETFDLVSACFLQSPVPIPRSQILRRAADVVAPSGSLLVISHAAPPPWAKNPENHDVLGPAEELTALGLDTHQWAVVQAEVRERLTTGPDGQQATVSDTVVRARRHSATPPR
jgi:SAM-dependent methyltransferase